MRSRKDLSNAPVWDAERERYFIEVRFPDGSRKKKRFQRVELGVVQTQREHRMTLNVLAPKSLNIQGGEKCFPKIALRTHHKAATCGILRHLISARKIALTRG